MPVYYDGGHGGGFQCESPKVEEPVVVDTDQDGTPDHSDDDIDGDGIANTYDDDVDGDSILNEADNDYSGSDIDTSSIDSGLAVISDTQNSTNRELQNLGLTLNDIAEDTSTISDYLTSGPSKTVEEATGGAATIAETSERIASAITNQPFISSILTIPTISTSNNCPVFVFPSNKFWSEITMDIHCVVLEQNRALLSALFIGLWTLCAAIVFLKA